MASRLLKAELSYAARGLPVFPVLEGGKRPLTPRGYLDATVDPDEIKRRRKKYPNANIGLPTGRVSGLLVIDVDIDRGGEEALAALEAEHGALPETLEARTGGGGRHLIFRSPTGADIKNSVDVLGLGVDVRADGGYIVVSPSVTTGRYQWRNSNPIAAAPEWLVKRLTKPASPRSKTPNPRADRGTAEPAGDGPEIIAGGRNVALTSIAGGLHDGTRSLEELAGDLQAINMERCSPPLSETEVGRIAASIHRRPPCAPRKARGEVDFWIRQLSEFWYSASWRGLGELGECRLARALIRLARDFGEVIPAGLRIEVSYRQLAEILGCHVNTITNTVRRSKRAGWLRADNKDRRPAGAGALVLVQPARILCDTLTTTCARGLTVTKDARPVADLKTEHYRHGGRVGYARERVLCAYEGYGPMDAEQAAERLGYARARDLERRHLRPLADLGLLERRGSEYGLPGTYVERQNAVRGRPYGAPRELLARQKSVEGRRVSFVREGGRLASELDRARSDKEKHRREREAFRLRHVTAQKPDYANLSVSQEAPASPEPPPVSSLAEAIREYLDRNRKDACQAPGWLGLTLWALDLYDGKPSPAEVKDALAELGGEPYLKSLLDRPRKDAA